MLRARTVIPVGFWMVFAAVAYCLYTMLTA